LSRPVGSGEDEVVSEDLQAARAAAEREVRRGNFKDAVDAYEALVRRHPGDASLEERLQTLRGMLQPMELVHPKAAAATARAPEAADEVHEAEAAANRGDLSAAIAVYRRLILAQPNPLFEERLGELLALAGDPVMRGALPRARGVQRPEPPRIRPSADPAIPTRDRLVPSDPPGPPPLPEDPVACLETLLNRIARARRRGV
jgi:tetratricopeptide (TPR) repeat protein